MISEMTTRPTNLAELRKKWLDEQTDGHKDGDINPWATIKQRANSLSESIRCECFNCVGADHDQNPVGRIKLCGISTCTLWLLRPYRSGSIKADIQEACAAVEPVAKRVVLDPATRARLNPQSRALAIRAYCWQCQGAGSNRNTGHLISACENYKCGVWDTRPYQQKTATTDTSGETE